MPAPYSAGVTDLCEACFWGDPTFTIVGVPDGFDDAGGAHDCTREIDRAIARQVEKRGLIVPFDFPEGGSEEETVVKDEWRGTDSAIEEMVERHGLVVPQDFL